MFRKVLIANRGEVAVRIARTCRRLGVATVGVYSEADRGLLHTQEVDESYELGPAPLAQSYLNQAALLEALKASGADAVHPGYGLLSEHAGFAQAVESACAKMIGPGVAALNAFGDKLSARALAKAQGIEPPPGTADAVDPNADEALRESARSIGLPLIVKAAGGGGGIGMSVVREWSELGPAAKACAQRGAAAFGDGRVYLERYLQRPRHIEVQVLRDRQGQVQVWGERECSVQRRHQKMIEESPSPAQALDSATRTRLFEQSARLMGSLPYEGLATVEYVADSHGRVYFLEVNPRLQVEHGVTEMTFGVDLVEKQLRVAAGQPLEHGPGQPRGHAIEVRIYAEDPRRNFLPQPGRLSRLRWPTTDPQHLRIETGLTEGDNITPHYDPLLAKMLAWGESRAEACRRLRDALAAVEIKLEGKTAERRTNRDLLLHLLNCPEFESGDYSTDLVSLRPEPV